MGDFQLIKKLLKMDDYKTDLQLKKEFSKIFFYANVCQYCGTFDQDLTVKRCSVCHGMFYCSREHQVAHFKEHKEFCGALKAVNEKKKDLQFSNKPGTKMVVKNYLMDLAECHLKRTLEPYERSMFLFPRICIVCNEDDQSKLIHCTDCPHANFCQQHWGIEEHKTVCKLFRFCFYLEQFWIVFKDLPIEDFINVIPHNSHVIDLPMSMDEYIDIYVRPYNKSLDVTVPEIRMLISKLITNSLTMIYTLQKLQLTNKEHLLIHVISKKRFDERNFHEWEILFHWFPNLKSLEVILLGIQITTRILHLTLCDTCKQKKRNLKIELSQFLYKDYFTKNPTKPDVIIAYNVDIMLFCTWIDAATLFSEMNVPIVLTAMETKYLIRGIQDCVPNPQKFSVIEKNPFRSMRPERSHRDIVYANSISAIYADRMLVKPFQKNLEDNSSSDEKKQTKKQEMNLISALEHDNFLLQQHLEVSKSYVEKGKQHNEKSYELVREFREMNDKYYSLEDKLFKHLQMD